MILSMHNAVSLIKHQVLFFRVQQKLA